MKKWVTILTAVLLCFTCLQVSALDVRAEDTVTIKVYNWGEYISDGSDDSMDVIKEFEAQYPGIKVSYTTYATNEELYAKLRSGSASYDVIVPSDYMISRMIAEDMLEPLSLIHI